MALWIDIGQFLSSNANEELRNLFSTFHQAIGQVHEAFKGCDRNRLFFHAKCNVLVDVAGSSGAVIEEADGGGQSAAHGNDNSKSSCKIYTQMTDNL